SARESASLVRPSLNAFRAALRISSTVSPCAPSRTAALRISSSADACMVFPPQDSSSPARGAGKGPCRRRGLAERLSLSDYHEGDDDQTQEKNFSISNSGVTTAGRTLAPARDSVNITARDGISFLFPFPPGG